MGTTSDMVHYVALPIDPFSFLWIHKHLLTPLLSSTFINLSLRRGLVTAVYLTLFTEHSVVMYPRICSEKFINFIGNFGAVRWQFYSFPCFLSHMLLVSAHVSINTLKTFQFGPSKIMTMHNFRENCWIIFSWMTVKCWIGSVLVYVSNNNSCELTCLMPNFWCSFSPLCNILHMGVSVLNIFWQMIKFINEENKMNIAALSNDSFFPCITWTPMVSCVLWDNNNNDFINMSDEV